jgi:hypothetical protein
LVLTKSKRRNAPEETILEMKYWSCALKRSASESRQA